MVLPAKPRFKDQGQTTVKSLQIQVGKYKYEYERLNVNEILSIHAPIIQLLQL